jgi:23S rRNA G2445 N2-methylase RlmL
LKHNNPSSKISDSHNTSLKRSEPNPLEVDPEKIEFHASCGEGLVDLLESEAKHFSLKITSKNRGGIFFTGNRAKLFSFFLSTEIASRIGFAIVDWKIQDYDDLYQESLEFPWEEILSSKESFRIEAKTKDCLPDSRFAMYKLKDGIMDRFRNNQIPFPDIERENADISILLRSYMDHAKVELLLSSDSLTKRGYRGKAGDATLRENLAAAIVSFSEWDGVSPIVDPFCGQGTILIEAALTWKKGAAKNWDKLSKSFIFKKLFSQELNDSNQSKQKDNRTPPLFLGLDESEEAIEQAIIDAKKAGVEDLICFEVSGFEEMDRYIPESIPEFWILTDPPYGRRLGSKEESAELFSKLGRYCKDLGRRSHLCLITGDTSLLGYLKLKKEKEMGLKNSQLKSKIVYYKIGFPREKYTEPSK